MYTQRVRNPVGEISILIHFQHHPHLLCSPNVSTPFSFQRISRSNILSSPSFAFSFGKNFLLAMVYLMSSALVLKTFTFVPCRRLSSRSMRLTCTLVDKAYYRREYEVPLARCECMDKLTFLHCLMDSGTGITPSSLHKACQSSSFVLLSVEPRC